MSINQTNIKVIIEKYHDLLKELGNEMEASNELERKMALEKNSHYTIFDKRRYLDDIEKEFNHEKYISLWERYFLYISRKGKRISDGSPIALIFYQQIILPILNEVYSEHEFPIFLKKLIVELEEREMYEEVQMINYYVKTSNSRYLFYLVDSIKEIARKVEGYTDFIKKYDLRN